MGYRRLYQLPPDRLTALWWSDVQPFHLADIAPELTHRHTSYRFYITPRQQQAAVGRSVYFLQIRDLLFEILETQVSAQRRRVFFDKGLSVRIVRR